MSDGAGRHSGAPEAAPATMPSAGATLRKAREQAGLHIGALAVALKVPVKKLEALETDQLDQLPDAVFARALASSVCRALKIDPDPVLRLLPQILVPRLAVEKRFHSTAFDTPGMAARLPFISGLPKPVLISTGLLLAAALGLWLLPSFNDPGPVRAPAKAEAPRVAPSLSVITEPGLPVVPTAVAVALPAQAATSATPASTPSPVALIAAAAGVAAPVSSEPRVPAAAPGSSLVVFRVRSASWVEVTDADGVVQLRKNLASGETASASGALPLSVIVGRADVTDVLVRGSAFDIAAVSKDNVARFQIK